MSTWFLLPLITIKIYVNIHIFSRVGQKLRMTDVSVLLEKSSDAAYFSFLVVRHPFDRLLSAYRDRILDGCTGQAKWHGPRILALAGNNRWEERVRVTSAYVVQWRRSFADVDMQNFGSWRFHRIMILSACTEKIHNFSKQLALCYLCVCCLFQTGWMKKILWQLQHNFLGRRRRLPHHSPDLFRIPCLRDQPQIGRCPLVQDIQGLRPLRHRIWRCHQTRDSRPRGGTNGTREHGLCDFTLSNCVNYVFSFCRTMWCTLQAWTTSGEWPDVTGRREEDRMRPGKNSTPR